MKHFTTRDMAQIAIVAAIYIVLTITPPLNAMSYYGYQFRVSEMMNFLAFYNKKYLIAVTIGCMIANLYSFGWIDVFVGGGSTFVFLGLGLLLFSRFKDKFLFSGVIRLDHFLFEIFFSISMFTIALELYYLQGQPFFYNWLTMGLGEFASLMFGAIIINKLSNYIDFTE